MIKLTKDEFVEEIFEELQCYEDIEEGHIKQFMDMLESYFENKKGKKDRISYKANSISITLKDESDIFDMVDNYLSAIINDDVLEYLNKFDI